MPNYSKAVTALLMGIIFISTMILINIVVKPPSLTCDSIPPNHYWGGEAPDGKYEVFLSSVDYESNTVSFPLCPSCPTELHGDWGFADGVIFPSDYVWLIVVLENNLIVKAWRLYAELQ